MTQVKTALICGVGGQDGALLSRLLLGKGYRVYGTSRDVEGKSFTNLERLGIAERVHFTSMNPKDFRSVLLALESSGADEVYFLAGQSSVGHSFEEPVETIESVMLGTLNMLEACRMLKRSIRQFYAGSIECYGDNNGLVVNEDSAFGPLSPYAVAKASTIWLVKNYREAYGMYACSGILSNHESPLRPVRFVTQKIVQGAKLISEGSATGLELGRLDISRDWGWAPQFVEAMWLMLQQDEPDDFLIATGQTHSLEEFVSTAFSLVGLDWREHVKHSQRFMRPSDISRSFTDPSKIERKIGWKARTTMHQVVEGMMRGDLS